MADRTVGRVAPPHSVTSTRKMLTVLGMYRDGKPVPPVVVLRFGARDLAITGSHRVAALRRMDASAPVEAPRFEVVDGDELEKRAMEQGDGELLRLLGLLQAGEIADEPGDIHRLVDAVSDYVDGTAREALRGQGDRA